MKASLVMHVKLEDEVNNTIEIKIWQLPEPTEDKAHGYKYSLAYILEGERVIGYDNGENKGDHRHYRETEKPYRFKDIDRLIEDFYKDIELYKGGGL